MARLQPAPKGVNTHNMKYLALIILAAASIGLGACAKDHHTSAPPPASTGMSK
jgi:hypothetical protein